MRSLGISVISVALTTLVVANAYYQKKQFYPSVVYITKSNPSMAVIYIQAFICVFLMGKIMRKVFFGELRTSEFEHLMERSWYAITETCLAFTVFRDDFNPKFVALFTLLLFLKSFHWLAEDRVDFMERSPIISMLFHIRVLGLLLVLGMLDVYFVGHAYQSTVSKGASVQLVFGFEYAILITMAINISIKYSLYSFDLNSETPWDNKAVFLLYTELIMGLIKVILYAAFVIIMIRIYTLPLFALRPMYYTLRNFKKAFNDVILSRRAIHNMNTLYPDATLEELTAGDNVCIICREEMTTAAKKLPCNHIFHAACLRSWFQRQQTCPTCRLNILRTPAPTPTPAAAENRQARPQMPQPPNMPNVAFNMPNPFMMLNNNLRNVLNGQAQGGPQAGVAGNVPQPGQAQQPHAPRMPNVPPFMPPNGGAAQTGADGAPNIPPFFPFPPMGFMTPPPMPPPNLFSISLEQLRRMEGNEREHVEARIQWLRNVQLMLDAAVLMMQQYNTAAAISLSMPNATADNSPASTTENAAGAAGDSNNTNTSTSEAGTASGSTTTNSFPPASDKNDVDKLGAMPSTSSSAPAADDENATAESMLRRRRLQKFEEPQDQQQAPAS
ncbi:E3 ubiquitin-protein ligase synoviolin B-like [Atheta coriaria]|uniref:E3 ubiquitin-protein ligase synoviolin B-like n=1 Tax=Dalotia coriaria TaxID=877792 RepID=UPI0031F3D607